MIRMGLSFALWLLVWFLLARPSSKHDLAVGAIVSAIVSVVTLDIFKSLDEAGAARRMPAKGFFGLLRRAGWFCIYVPVFLWECVKANIDVAYRVLHPGLPIRPGTFRVKTALRSDAGLTFLTSSITLTPGMTTVDVDKDKGNVYIHFLYVGDSSGRGCPRLAAVTRYEKILDRIFE